MTEEIECQIHGAGCLHCGTACGYGIEKLEKKIKWLEAACAERDRVLLHIKRKDHPFPDGSALLAAIEKAVEVLNYARSVTQPKSLRQPDLYEKIMEALAALRPFVGGKK